jgi:hypothetical protein
LDLFVDASLLAGNGAGVVDVGEGAAGVGTGEDMSAGVLVVERWGVRLRLGEQERDLLRAGCRVAAGAGAMCEIQ